MRKLLLCGYAAGTLLCVALFVDVAAAGVEGPDEFHGHGDQQCEPATHLAYYDPRRDGQTVYNQDRPNGDNTYYVDDDPLAGFQPDGNYETGNAPNQDCEGTPVLRWTAYGGVTVIGNSPEEDKNIGFPSCANPPEPRNPYCPGDKTGVRAAFYVAKPDQSEEVGYSFGVTVP